MATRMSQDRAQAFIIRLLRDQVSFSVTYNDDHVYVEDNVDSTERFRPILCKADGPE